MKATIVYQSSGGNTKKMAELMAEAMNTVEGVEAKAFSIENVDYDFAKESKCLIAGSPIYMATMTAAMHTWLQTNLRDCNPSGKLGGAFATANYVHGGGELGIRNTLDIMLVMGMLTYSGGGSFGVPVIHLGPLGIGEKMDETVANFEIYAKRMAQKAVEIFGA